MSEPSLDPVAVLALAWQPSRDRSRLETLLLLDRRLQTLTSRAGEPMLAQIRLAWWREQLASPAAHADPLLQRLTAEWREATDRLTPLVDAWERLLPSEEWDAVAIQHLAEARGHALAAFARSQAGSTTHDCEQAALAGQAWAYADLSRFARSDTARAEALKIGRTLAVPHLPNRQLRGIAVLGGLAERALRRGEPMLSGRRAALVAMRLGIIGR